jgi:anhydro-N-acetylmuramic acid kinase
MPQLYIGAMSGTSLDGVDAVLVDFEGRPRVVGHVHEPYSTDLAQALLALNTPGHNELHRAATCTEAISVAHAQAVERLLERTCHTAADIVAIGVHGQTVRHQPRAFGDSGYTWQLDPGAQLSARLGIDTVSDFRSQDVALGGQGAPLVPAFHEGVFGDAGVAVAVLNLGGMANLTLVPPGGPVTGFDTGPANALIDAWCLRHQGQRFDAGGQWAASGRVHAGLLRHWLADAYFARAAPKSTGREHFNAAWIEQGLAAMSAGPVVPVDVQATLTELTAVTVAQALIASGTAWARLWVCGGGAHNQHLLARLQHHLVGVAVAPSSQAGWPVDQVEAAAFAWLARARMLGEPNTRTTVTGARSASCAGSWRRRWP